MFSKRPPESPAPSAVRPATEHIAGEPRDILSDEDPDDPLIAQRRRAEARRRSANAYQEAYEKLTDRVDGPFATSIRRSAGQQAVFQGAVLALRFVLMGAFNPAAAIIGSIAALGLAVTEGRITRPLRAMRKAIKTSPTPAADRLVYELHRATAFTTWISKSKGVFPLGRRLAKWRATRAVHRAIDRAIAGLDQPETEATARVVLPKATALLEELIRKDLISWPAQRRHCNRMYRKARATGDANVVQALYCELAVTGDRSLSRLLDELGHPKSLLPIRTKVFMTVRDGELEDVPRWLRGERHYLRGILREARRVQMLAQAESVILEHLRIDPTVAGSRSDSPARIAAAGRIAEMRVMRYRLGDRNVSREHLIADARRVEFLAGVVSGVPASVRTANAERLRSAGIDPSELRPQSTREPETLDPNQGTHVSQERIAEIFATVPGFDPKSVGRSSGTSGP